LSNSKPSLAQLAAHNLDAILAVLALPAFLLAGLPLAGWFWAVALWSVNRFLQALVERRAVQMGALRAVGVMGASMLLRPWIGMLVLFLLLVTVDIVLRILTHKNIRTQVGGVAQ
jgi:hypothetical protein